MAKLYISMYHYIRDLKNSPYPQIKGLDLPLFKQQIGFFKSHFSVVTIEDVISHYEKGSMLPENALLLTFDDGYIDHYETVFPILKENGMQGSFFIPGKTFTENIMLDVNKIHFILAVAPIDELYNDLLDRIDYLNFNHEYDVTKQELIDQYAKANRFDPKEVIFIKRVLQMALPEQIRNRISSELFEKYVGIREDEFARKLYMNIDQIKEMKDNGMYIGVHGYDHYWLGNLPKEKMQEDIEHSMKVLSDVIDKDCFIMNYPYGSYNDDVLTYLRVKGCRLGMTTEVRIVDTQKDDRLLLPRLDCNDFPPKSENYLVI